MRWRSADGDRGPARVVFETPARRLSHSAGPRTNNARVSSESSHALSAVDVSRGTRSLPSCLCGNRLETRWIPHPGRTMRAGFRSFPETQRQLRWRPSSGFPGAGRHRPASAGGRGRGADRLIGGVADARTCGGRPPCALAPAVPRPSGGAGRRPGVPDLAARTPAAPPVGVGWATDRETRGDGRLRAAEVGLIPGSPTSAITSQFSYVAAPGRRTHVSRGCHPGLAAGEPDREARSLARAILEAAPGHPRRRHVAVQPSHTSRWRSSARRPANARSSPGPRERPATSGQ